MVLPNRHIQDANAYRYAYQGQEKDPETGKEAFELRLWDGRIGRWLTTDPYGQYVSPYLGMGNNPISRIDPNGGSDGGPGDPPTINLDAVVITGHCGSNCGNNTPHLANIDFRNFDPSFPTWTTSFKGNLNDWNKKNGTNFKDHYAAYAFWLESQKQREMNAMESQIHSATNQAAEIILETGLNFAPVGEIYVGGKLIFLGITKTAKITEYGYRAFKVGSASSKGLLSSKIATKFLRKYGLNIKFFGPTLYGGSKTLGTFLGRNSPILGTGLVLDGSRRFYNNIQN